MAADAIERDEKPAPLVKTRGLRQLRAMADSAGGLDVADGKDRLLPGERRLVRVANLRGTCLPRTRRLGLYTATLRKLLNGL